jgi:oxepin-CoA hydrolase/3-oxo-5,6-dehydrosuberyl-CoA semialdehyde dehydrogenase
MDTLPSLLRGQWVDGDGDPTPLLNPATELPLAQVRRAGQLGNALAWAREVGGPALRSLSWASRAALLGTVAKRLHAAREELLALAVRSGGNTRGDAKFDVDGAIAVLAHYAELGEALSADTPWLRDGDDVAVLRNGKLRVQHAALPRHGVAIHINAFNFPAWGMVGKLAVALLAGVPVLSKPATSTSALAHRIGQLLAEPGLLPEGAFQLLMGSAGDLLDHVGPQDLIAFTGSADTGATIRTHPAVVRHGVRVNVEADSLNAVVVGGDVEAGSELFDALVRDAITELTQKAGQKCTATRRLIVPSGLLPALRERLVEGLDDVAAKTGDPADEAVRMGPLATAGQLRDARAGVEQLRSAAKLVRGDTARRSFRGVEDGRGYFLEPVLLEAEAGAATAADAPFHHHEVFGPVATLLPYDGSIAQAAEIVALGQGSLVTTLYSDARETLRAAVDGLAPYLGRLVLVDGKGAGASLSPGAVLPACNHGGPGRAGGGAELGGRGGLEFYLQRTAVQAPAHLLKRLFD